MTPNDGKTLNQLVAIDTETSGPDLFENSLLYLALVPYDNRIKPLECAIKWDSEPKWSGKGKEFFLNYKSRYESIALQLNQVCEEVERYTQVNFPYGMTLVGHNVAFDYYFLKKSFHQAAKKFPELISHRTVDTHTLIFERILRGELSHEFASSDFAFKLLSPRPWIRHSALDDAQFALDLFKKLLAL